MLEDKEELFPDDSIGYKLAAVTAALSAVALTVGDLKSLAVGGGSVFIQQFLAPIFRRRQTQFFDDLAARLRRLESRLEKVEVNVEKFADAVAQAAVAAVKTSDSVKREAC